MSSPQDQRDQEAAGSQPDESSRLRKEVDELKLLLGRAAERVQRLETELGTARSQVAWFHRQLFGQKAERASLQDLEMAWHAFLREQEAKARGLPELEARPITAELSSIQLLLGFVAPAKVDQTPAPIEPTPDEPDAAAPDADGESPPPAPKKKGHGRTPVPPTLREETIVIEPENVPAGSRRVGAEIAYRVGIRRAEMIRYAFIRPKYAADDDAEAASKFIVADMPHEMIPRGILTPSGLAHVIASKWDRHVPYHRLGRYFAECGYSLPVSTLSGVAIRAAPLATTLVEAMRAYAQQVAPYLGIDATGALLQQPEVCARGHVWLSYVERVCVLVAFTKTHDSVTAGAQLDGWNCPTLADGAQVYDRKQSETKNARAGCWSHGRRNLIYAVPTDPRALVGVRLINDLFAVERTILEASPERRLAERKRRSAPLIDQLFRWRDDLLARGNLGRSPLAGALGYLRNQAERLTYFLKDGRVPIHNNLTELQARHLAVGRKNWLFFGSEGGAAAGSTWLSLVLSARMHDLDVEEYLRDLFRVLPGWPRHRLIELAPHRWNETRSNLDPVQMYRELGSITIPPIAR